MPLCVTAVTRFGTAVADLGTPPPGRGAALRHCDRAGHRQVPLCVTAYTEGDEKCPLGDKDCPLDKRPGMCIGREDAQEAA